MATVATRFGDYGVDDPVSRRIARLTPGQLECLGLVFQHLNSKEIAGRLSISSHTVDQRVRQALHILGVERRSEAARMVAEAGLLPREYQRLIHQPPHIDGSPDDRHQDGAVSHQIRHADRAGGTGSTGVTTEQTSVDRQSLLSLPFATRSQPRNEMSVGSRLLWIVIIAMGATFSAGMYLAGLESLSRMVAH